LAIFDVFISQNRLDVPWKVLRKFGYSNSLDLAIPKNILDNKFPSLSIASRKFLVALFHQFDSNRDGILSPDDIKKIFSIVPEPALPPWHPVRAKKLLKGCFSLPKDTYEKAMSENITTNTPPDQMDFSLSASGITISSATTLPTVGELHSSSSVGVTLSSMTLLDWMGHWHMLAAISPSAATAELYRLGHKSISNQKMKRIKNRQERELSVVVVGSQGCGKTSLLQLLLQRDPHETEPTVMAETSTTHCKYKMKASEKDEKGEDMVVHFIFTEVPRDLLTKENFEPLISMSMNQKVLVVFCFDTENSLLDAIKLEETMLNDGIARVFVVSKKGKGDDEEMQSVHRAAEEHCRELDLELPFFTNTFDDNILKEQRESILKHLAQCGMQQPYLDASNLKKSKPHAEQKRREAEKRRRMIWFGGLVAVAVVGVGVFWTNVVVNSKERKSRWGGWLTNLLFGEKTKAVNEKS